MVRKISRPALRRKGGWPAPPGDAGPLERLLRQIVAVHPGTVVAFGFHIDGAVGVANLLARKTVHGLLLGAAAFGRGQERADTGGRRSRDHGRLVGAYRLGDA